MRYDTSRLVVEAGKPFEVIFENMDLMGHNFVIVEPGSRKAVAESAQTMNPNQLDKQGRAFIPKNEKRIIAATKLVEPGEKQILNVTAPEKEGEYEYICTFPGHWMIMWGTLVVTKNPDSKL
jgi:azurin